MRREKNSHNDFINPSFGDLSLSWFRSLGRLHRRRLLSATIDGGSRKPVSSWYRLNLRGIQGMTTHLFGAHMLSATITERINQPLY
jgi:hypothetical protein